MGVTIFDVAEEAGVSKATVSRAFTNPSAVHPDTLQNIMNAVERLGYTPNAVARAMITKKTENIGFIIFQKQKPVITNPFYGPILEHVIYATRSKGYSLFICSDDDLRAPSGDMLLQKQVDGVILASHTDEQTVLAFQKRGIPAVLVNCSISLPSAYSILSDDFGGVKSAITHFYECGHRDIAMLAGAFTPFIFQRRNEAFALAMQAVGLTPDEAFVKTVAPTIHDAYQAVQHMLQQPRRPTALFCTNDKIAAGAIKAVVRLGMRVPEDISIIGYDNSDLCSVCEPEISSVDTNAAELGSRAVECLFAQMAGKPPAEKIVTVSTSLVLRSSTRDISL